MKLTIRIRHLDLTPDLRSKMERRLRFAFDRFATMIHEAEASLVDVNGPRGGPDKVCTICLRGATTRTIFVEQRGIDAYATLSLAADRAARALGRARARHRTVTSSAPALPRST